MRCFLALLLLSPCYQGKHKAAHPKQVRGFASGECVGFGPTLSCVSCVRGRAQHSGGTGSAPHHVGHVWGSLMATLFFGGWEFTRTDSCWAVTFVLGPENRTWSALAPRTDVALEAVT